MVIEPHRKRTSRMQTASYRRKLFAQQRPPKRSARPLFRQRRGRWSAMLLCFSAAAVLLMGVVSFSSLSSHQASADNDSEKRAAKDVASLQADPSQEQRVVSIDVPAIQQYPELPTGCESVALTNALLSFGFELEKTDIADVWLPKSDSDFVNAFEGNPHATDGNSCMAPAIVLAANAFLAAQESSLEAIDLTGASLIEVLKEVAAGNPVIAWCTIGLGDPGTAYQAESVVDRTYRMYENSHCVVISGYNLDSNVVMVSDSLAGQVSYNLQQFAARYYEMGTQAVVIK